MNWLNRNTQDIALEWGGGTITYAELNIEVAARRDWLKGLGVHRVALIMDNSPNWVLFDFACQQLEICMVPMPGFFSASQTEHVLHDAGIELVVSDHSVSFFNAQQVHCPFGGIFAWHFTEVFTPAVPDGTHKITFTSGSTGTPKGVCLSSRSQFVVAESLVKRIALDAPRHLCLLPLTLLLENIAGLYAPLMAGGTVILSDEVERGVKGSRLVNPDAMIKLISEVEPDSLIVVPELLMVLLGAVTKGWQPPVSLKFIAVGGAHIAVDLLINARQAGLPVYQGYGLSECVSVTTLNVPEDEAVQSVGRCLPHTALAIEKGEVIATGNLFLGYLNKPESFYPKQVATGDLGAQKDEHFYIHGRKSNLIINSFGRNISPEWIESLIMASGMFMQCLIAGEARPFCVALLVPSDPQASHLEIEQSLDQVNLQLPDYAQIQRWLTVPAFTEQQNTLTATGKLKRKNILMQYQPALQQLYQPLAV